MEAARQQWRRLVCRATLSLLLCAASCVVYKAAATSTALSFLTRNGCKITFGGAGGGQRLPGRTPSLISLYIDGIYSIQLTGGNVDSEAFVRAMSALGKTEELYFTDCLVSNCHLAKILKCSDPVRLDLSGSTIYGCTAAQWNMSRLEMVALCHTSCDESLYSRLPEYSSLRAVFLNGTPIDDGLCGELLGLPFLTVLGVTNTQVSVRGIAKASRSPSLLLLDLRRTKIVLSDLSDLTAHRRSKVIVLTPEQSASGVSALIPANVGPEIRVTIQASDE